MLNDIDNISVVFPSDDMTLRLKLGTDRVYDEFKVLRNLTFKAVYSGNTLLGALW